jgi:hypothetical protein
VAIRNSEITPSNEPLSHSLLPYSKSSVQS